MDYTLFLTRASNLVHRACGENSEHYRALRRVTEGESSATNSVFLPSCLGVVEAARRDIESGLLFDFRARIQAEQLGDFMDQAEVLIREGYFCPAASLAGSILEDILRKLSEKRRIPRAKRSNIGSLNADLASAGVYNNLTQKQITALAEIRNNADHGRYNEFKHEDVEDMVKWVRRFAEEQLK